MKNYTPVYVLIDTNFIYFTIKNKLNLNESLVNCLNQLTIPCVSECVVLELEKLGPKFKLALKYLKNRSIIKLNCFHPKNIIYADDCIYNTVKLFPHFIVATCDNNLKKRIKKIPNINLISIKKNKFKLN